ncbi:MAG: two-component system, OmpR family, sensor histidine kinase MprB [Gaiellales bacterium]|nr:two-component system, OmpR family, sensor histidine kinase MprB [Gaiellales bacterium]
MTLRTRIAAAAGIAVAITALALAAGDYAGTRSTLRGQIDTALTTRAQQVTDQNLHQPGPPGGTHDGKGGGDGGGDGPFNFGPQSTQYGDASGFVQQIAPDGTVSQGNPSDTGKLPLDARARATAKSGSGRYFSDTHVNGVHLREQTDGIGPNGAIQVARPLTEVDDELSRLLVQLAIVAGVGVLLAIALGAIVARTALKPIRSFTRTTEALTGDPDLSHRLEETGRDELTRLARSFNRTLDALETSAAAQSNLVADASHELRTPIASLRANIQVLEDADRLAPEDLADLRADIISELDELTALVGDIVELARGSRPAERLDDVQLDTLVAALIDRFERRFPDLLFERTLEPTVVSGEPERMARAVSNLLDNASKWSPPGGTIEIVLAGDTLTVRDHGRGFAEQDLPHVFDRFYRASDARSSTGSGLGLAIVRQAAESHGGLVEALNAPGGGGMVRVRFSAPA